MAILALNNGDSFGTQRTKINNNFSFLDTNKADSSNTLLKDNTTVFTPSGNYNPATKLYADQREAAIKSLYDPQNILGDAFDRANHTGVQAASSITQDINNRFVSDAEKATWNGKETAFSKNTGFNLDLGSIAGTVAEGNHTHTGVYEAANANIQNHISITAGNPHGATATDVGAEPADAAIQTHINNVTTNPHNVTASQVGLGNVDNTADEDKPVSNDTLTQLNLKVDKNNPVFGDFNAGDYSTFESDGTLVFNGSATVWNDIATSLIGKALYSVVGTVNYNFAENGIDFSQNGSLADQNDTVVFSIQLPHGILFSTLNFHIHWIQTDTTDFEFDWQYRIQNHGEATTTGWTTTTGFNIRQNAAFTYSTGSLNQITSLENIDISGAGLSAVVEFQITRSDNNGGTCLVKFLDSHYQLSLPGSRLEFTQ